MNSRAISCLEYDKILDMLRSHIVSDIGMELADRISPTDDYQTACRLLAETEEADSVYRQAGKTPVEWFPDMRETLIKIHAAAALSTRELLELAICLKASRNARDVLEGREGLKYLGSLGMRLASHRSIEEEIHRCILSEEEIADNASPELSRIRRQMLIVNERMKDKLNTMIRSSAYSSYLQEPIVTMRNGRYALPVKAEFRSQIPGLIHDQSGSGATLFIEPAAVVELGNELRKLSLEENVEISRILAGLTSLVDQVSGELLSSLEMLGRMDVIFARAIMARDMRAVCPKLNAEHRINILSGRHPLLDKNRVVPVSVSLGISYRTLIITGPNTGGKTVTLKTVGLFSLMAMSGMFVPADEKTELSVFREVYADIGDEQSIEQSLSTFSSHMTNTVGILDKADTDCLVLLDELGAGTDPIEGAALAQAMLEKLYYDGALTLATTHYSEIKAFALTHDGMQNASMEFDVERLCPTYRLFIGIPGKSNAFEISKRLGLSDEVIAAAQRFLQKRDIAFEDVLSGAENARKDAEEQREQAGVALLEAEKIRRELKEKQDKLEAERFELRRKAKEDARKLVQDTREDMEKLIRDLRSVPNIDTKALERAIQQSRDALRAREEQLIEERKIVEENGSAPKSVAVGEKVHVLSLDKDATVLKPVNAKGDVYVQIGSIKTNVKLSDIRKAEKKQEKKKATHAITLHEPSRSFMELDLRGKTIDEGIVEVDRFIDDALLTGIHEFSVIHGKGTGALRSGIQNFLRTHPQVKSYRIGAYGEGDAGVTVVTLK